MSIPVHRDGDLRICGATTTVVNQSTVFANGKLIATNGDPNSDGGGGLIASCKNVYINGILVSNDSPDSAEPDSLCPIPPHCSPSTAQGSPNVFVGD